MEATDDLLDFAETQVKEIDLTIVNTLNLTMVKSPELTVVNLWSPGYSTRVYKVYRCMTSMSEFHRRFCHL